MPLALLEEWGWNSLLSLAQWLHHLGRCQSIDKALPDLWVCNLNVYHTQLIFEQLVMN